MCFVKRKLAQWAVTLHRGRLSVCLSLMAPVLFSNSLRKFLGFLECCILFSCLLGVVEHPDHHQAVPGVLSSLHRSRCPGWGETGPRGRVHQSHPGACVRGEVKHKRTFGDGANMHASISTRLDEKRLGVLFNVFDETARFC